LTGEAELAAILERPVEEWMLFLHPAQRRMVELSTDGPVRVRGGAGTGKTVVALHRARAIARTGSGRVLLTTFVTTLPRTWEGLFSTFDPDVRSRLDIRTVDAIAYDLYRDGGGWAEPAQDSWLEGVVRELHGDDAEGVGGLTSLALRDEFDYVITGRGLLSWEAYEQLPRTGRGTALGAAARREVWKRYERYRERLDDEGRYGWHELRAEALRMLSEGAVRRRYAAVIADETQDLTETSVRLLVALAGGGHRPALTLVGDGQQSIYPGGFSLRSLGVEVRGRSFVLRTNWRNTADVWLAACAFIAGDEFDDLEDELSGRTDAEVPYAIRAGAAPRLHRVVDAEEAADWIAALVAEDLATGANPGDGVVLAPTNAAVAALESALRRAGVPVRRLERYAGEHVDAVWVGTFHRSKGLEFKRVYIAGVDAHSWPPRLPGLEPEAQQDADARATRAAFVAMTRARDQLDVVTAGDPARQLADAAWAFDR
jgi:superfamily I DNA/RNA helicase